MFVDDMILYIENTQHSTKIMLELINEFSKVAKYKIFRNGLHFYTPITDYGGNKIKKTTPFAIALRRIKYLGTNLTQEVKEPCSKQQHAEETGGADKWRQTPRAQGGRVGR